MPSEDVTTCTNPLRTPRKCARAQLRARAIPAQSVTFVKSEGVRMLRAPARHAGRPLPTQGAQPERPRRSRAAFSVIAISTAAR